MIKDVKLIPSLKMAQQQELTLAEFKDLFGLEDNQYTVEFIRSTIDFLHDLQCKKYDWMLYSYIKQLRDSSSNIRRSYLTYTRLTR